jgi:hypothetical protein
LEHIYYKFECKHLIAIWMPNKEAT